MPCGISLASGQLADEVSVDGHALLRDEKGVRVQLVDHAVEVGLLKFGDAHAQHAQVLSGVGALALPVGHAAPEPCHDVPRQLGVLVLGEDEHLLGDVLLVPAVDEERAEHRINDGIDRRAQTEEDRAERVEQRVEAQAEAPHAEALALLGEPQSEDVQPAGRAAAGEHDAEREADEDAAEHAVRQRLLHQRRRRRRHKAQKQRRGDGTHRGAHKETPSQRLPRQQQDGHVRRQIQDARKVHVRRQPQRLHDQRAGDLAEAQQAAGVKSHRDNEPVHADGVEQRRGHGQSQTAPPVLYRFVQHRHSLRSRFPCAFYCMRTACRSQARTTARSAGIDRAAVWRAAACGTLWIC